MKILVPSILSADFARLGEQVAEAERAGVGWLHVDVMDGHFVPNITTGPAVVAALRRVTRLPLSVHLMTLQPGRFLADFAAAGADWLTVHAEAAVHLHRDLAAIHDLGLKAGVALNPATPLSVLDYVLPDCDLVLVMSVNPGFGGQRFIPGMLGKIGRLRRLIDQADLPTLIAVDGGVKPDNIRQIAEAGADVLVAGSAIFGQPDIGAAIRHLRERLEGG